MQQGRVSSLLYGYDLPIELWSAHGAVPLDKLLAGLRNISVEPKNLHT